MNKDFAAALKTEFTAMEDYLTAASDVMKSGYMPDMTGFDRRVAILCDAIKSAEPPLQKEYKPRLVQFQERLDEFQKKMQTFHDLQTKQRGHGNA